MSEGWFLFCVFDLVSFVFFSQRSIHYKQSKKQMSHQRSTGGQNSRTVTINAKMMMEGVVMVKDEKSAVMLLESNMNDLEPDGLLLLAKCYAFGRGTTPNRMGAEDLIQRAAEMESEEALLLREIFDQLNEQRDLNLWSLFDSFLKTLPMTSIIFVFFVLDGINGDYTIERIALLMALGSWESGDLHRVHL